MSKRGVGRLADFKGAELLARLKAGLSRSSPTEPSAKYEPPKPVPSERLVSPPRTAAKPHLTPDAEKAQRKLKNKKTESAESTGITIIKVRTAQEKALYRQAILDLAQKQPLSNAAAGSPPSPTIDFGEGCFRKLAPMREALDGFAANHRGSTDIPPVDRSVVLDRIAAGAARAADVLDEVDGYFLGYDFGTSTTKVVARNPYALGSIDEAFAIDVPLSVCSDNQPHLFPTAVYWSKERDHFSLLPSEGYQLLDSFKSALIQGRGHRMCKGTGLTMAEAATAFVALHLAYCIGAGLEENASFKLNAMNAGIPVAVLDGQANVMLFDRVLSAATHLVESAENLSSAQVKSALAQPRDAAIPVTRHAELAGAIAGYCSATRHYLGGHMIIDCGSATFDVVTFDLNQQTHRPIGIYGAAVENLGADACSLFLRSGSTIEECRQAIRYVEHVVYRQTLKIRSNLFSQDSSGYPYQIILIGGGVHSDVHSGFLAKLADAIEKPFLQPEIAPTLRYDARCEAGRLILADGLARDPVELRDIVLVKPSETLKWQDPGAPGPEQV